MHLNSKLMFREHGLSFLKPGMKVLEIGPDRFPSSYQQMLGRVVIQWDTLDIYDSDQLTYKCTSEYEFPIPDDTYDVVISSQVIEHVKRIWVWTAELARICKKGGLVITVNPVSWPYHEAPVDCWRAYPEGMKALYQDSGLEVELSEWGSMEIPERKRRLPGRSIQWQPKALRAAYRVLGLFGFPIECAFDTITVGRKR